MSSGRGSQSISLKDAKDKAPTLYRHYDDAVRTAQNAENADVIHFLTSDRIVKFLDEDEYTQPLDTHHEDGLGEIRQAVLFSDCNPEHKKAIHFRADDTPQNIRVPQDVQDNAFGALEAGKPVVLYGPTGTGKTTFAKQLANEHKNNIGYEIHTATPSWTAEDIIGRIEPKLTDKEEGLSYHKRLGAVTQAVDQARKICDEGYTYTVILDEITRADISRIFGPLYSAIENPQQTIFEVDDQNSIQLDNNVNIICTMNISDRTVNELDDAITRRFAMVDVDHFTDEGRQQLFNDWIESMDLPINGKMLRKLFERDHDQLNNRDGDTRTPIQQFGPMHYRDVLSFLEATCMEDGRYEQRPYEAVGQAYRTYIIPRLLNTASYDQMARIHDHYTDLNSRFDFDLSPAIDLVERRQQNTRQQLGINE
ncbi:AAA family ATPase [Halostagnicola sp. A-GB9-2]|uniref:AAA family ATPase n=1 Tax=Halostagnicola sp. A-GB9-2 TaxID=3048066 RepID=UPI0024C00B98|nr:AAA family ATPase [Halostagnicola sp. A-GB9-2]MDJ1430553.1 AAA family ATPase [Halostagnicola sp. A-GB9-2]